MPNMFLLITSRADYVDETWLDYVGNHPKAKHMSRWQTESRIPIWRPFVFRKRK